MHTVSWIMQPGIGLLDFQHSTVFSMQWHLSLVFLYPKNNHLQILAFADLLS